MDKTPCISDFAHQRDNNYNLIRVVLALAVWLGHCFVFHRGGNTPVTEVTGAFAVNIFFAVSGFLIAKSVCLRASITAFCRARILRIYPAAIVLSLVVVFIIGPAVTSEEVASYFSNVKTYVFLIINSTLIILRNSLPGVFESNPISGVINGSLWTLPWEIRAYFIVGVLAFFVGIHKRISTFFFVSVILLEALYTQYPWSSKWYVEVALRFFSYFFMGVLLYKYRDAIALRLKYFVMSVLVMAVSYFFGIFELAALFFLPYAVFYLVYVPAWVIRHYSRLGDYSYGIYIYHSVVLQVLLYYYTSISLMLLIGLSFVVTMALAIASWHFIENPSLALKDRPLKILGCQL